MTDFYALLGFEAVEPPPTLAGRAVWLEQGATQVHLQTIESGAPAPRGGHFAVVAGRYAETLAALRAAGHEPHPRQEHWGVLRAFVSDPAGNTVEIMAAAP